MCEEKTRQVSMDKLEEFIREHEITEVECLVPDMSGIARGKIILLTSFYVYYGKEECLSPNLFSSKR